MKKGKEEYEEYYVTAKLAVENAADFCLAGEILAQNGLPGKAFVMVSYCLEELGGR